MKVFKSTIIDTSPNIIMCLGFFQVSPFLSQHIHVQPQKDLKINGKWLSSCFYKKEMITTATLINFCLVTCQNDIT